MAKFWFRAEGPKCRETHSGNRLYPRKCSLSYEKSLSDRSPIFGKIDTQKLPNVQLYWRAGRGVAAGGDELVGGGGVEVSVLGEQPGLQEVSSCGDSRVIFELQFAGFLR